MRKRKNFWWWAKYIGGTAVAVSGAVLGLPVILAGAGIAVAIPGAVTTAASVIGALGTATTVVADKVDKVVKDLPAE